MKNTVAVIVIALAIVAGVFIIGRSYNYKFKTRNTVNVLGSSEHNFTADLIVWSGTFPVPLWT
jgi:uncharacterized protein